MAEPFDTLAADLADIIARIHAGTLAEGGAATELIPLLTELAPTSTLQLDKVIQVLGRLEGHLFTDGVPADTLGAVGATAIDLTAKVFYGPKTALGWGVGEAYGAPFSGTLADFLATPTSANLAAAVTDETGTGALVFNASPTLVTPALGAATATSLTTTGSVGIGTSSTPYPLSMETSGSSLTHNIRINAPASGANYGEIAFQLWNGSGPGINTFGGAGTSRPSVVIRGQSESGSATGALVIGAFAGGATNAGLTEKMRVSSAGHVTPGTDNTQNLGAGSLRWGTIYAGTGTINTSDERYKLIRAGAGLSDAEYRAWSDVRAIVYQDRDSYARSGDDARLHIGYSWQAIQAAFATQGLDASRYGLWCEDPVLAPVAKTQTARRQAVDADGNPLVEVMPVLDADGQPVFEQVQAATAVEQSYEDVRIVDGVPVLVRGVRTVKQPLFDSVQVRDAETGELLFDTPDAGPPVPRMASVPRMVSRARTETVPVMEDFEQAFTEMEPTGETMGALRYQECAVLEAAWLRRELAMVEARVAALEN